MGFPGVVFDTRVEVKYGHDRRVVEKNISERNPRFGYGRMIDRQVAP
jgi:hypothetical protein